MRADARVFLVGLATLLTGCASGSPAPPTTPARLPVSAAAPAPVDPVTACANQLTYWAGEQLRGAPDAGLDYQEMALTSAQADALAVLVDQARAQGPARPPDWVPRRARELCTQITAHPRPTGGGWPP